jgi:DNA polymerase-3 subunit epsilon/CBS domain-containing protein
MVAGQSATQLITLDAVVLDTETTGLDARNARVVEIAAVHLEGGRLDERRSLRQLVNPGVPIPSQATEIHGIDNARVAGMPAFAAAWPNISAFIGDSVMVGHSIGFDLGVLHNECNRSNLGWHPPPALDVALLARAAAPTLASYSLESLAAWLGIEVTGRHSALGDAILTGRIFIALLPRLRERDIRTLAEAIRVSQEFHALLEEHHRAGWSETEPIWRRLDGKAERARADTRPYRHRAGEIMTSPPRTIERGVRLGEALKIMAEEKISSVFVGSGTGPAKPADLGIITERDVLRMLGRHGAAALDAPAQAAMSRPLVTVPAEALTYVAIGRMNRLGIRHLGVTDSEGVVAGALSARDLLRLRTDGAIELGDELAAAEGAPDLARSWTKVARLASDLRADGLSGREIAAVVSQNIIEVTRRAAGLSEAWMAESGAGPPPSGYAIAVLGSAGRGESLLAMDQDNALVWTGDPPDAEAWFEPFARRLNDILHEAGIPYCKGGVMARNPPWRGSEAEWRARIEHWILRASPEDLLSVDIFFDLRVAHGDQALGERLWRHGFDMAQGRPAFAKQLIAGLGAMPVARGWFGRLRTEQGRIDLKRSGLFGVVSIARALAVCHHVVERSTAARLSGLIERKLGLQSDLDALIDAQGTFLDLILRQQIEDITHGHKPGNTVEVKGLSRRERARLETALQTVETVDEIARTLLFQR